MSLFATHEDVAMLKERALKWEADGFPNADHYVPNLIKVINQLPFMASVFCCEGHPREDRRPPGPDHKEGFHLAMAVTEEGFRIISVVYTLIRDRMLERGRLSKHRVKSFRICLTTKNYPKSLETYPALVLQFDVSGDGGIKTQFFEDLHWAINQAMHGFRQ